MYHGSGPSSNRYHPSYDHVRYYEHPAVAAARPSDQHMVEWQAASMASVVAGEYLNEPPPFNGEDPMVAAPPVAPAESPQPVLAPEPEATPQVLPSSGQRGGDATYVLRIHEMLEDADKEGHQQIVSWQPHGRAFKAHKEKEFVEQIMPRYFKAKIGSFRRWLRAWGFVRMTEGKDRGAWYHRYFVRGVTGLCKNMTRQQMQQSMKGWPPAGQVPDFYIAASGTTLSEQHHVPQVAAGTLDVVKNPKRLRGTILEDLRQMLQEAEQEGNAHMVSWMPHGRAFKIYNRTQFEGIIMPRYFKTGKVTHFSDTLRIWGFCRLKQDGPDKGAYYHRYFVRGDTSLSRHRTRIQMKNSMIGWRGNGEPDLYAPPEPAVPLEQVAAAPSQVQVPLHPPPGAPIPHPQTVEQHAASRSAPHFPPDPIHFLQPEQQPNPAQAAEGQNVYYDPNYMQPSTDAGIAAYAAAPPEDVAKSSDGTYVLRIHEMLEDAEKEGNQAIVSWQPHGRAFRIHNEGGFVKDIMPRYFKAKIGSFIRWLRAWGFVRMTEGKDRGGWYHRYFVRGVTSLCRNMTRQQMLKAMENWLPSGQVVDFYSSGTGDVLSEAPIQSPPGFQCVKNPKRLRGIVCEELRAMLADAEAEGNMNIVSWLPHGRAFIIYNKTVFAEKTMRRYFKATKFTYFSDTLRIWGFHRLKRGPDKGAYYHKWFVKGQPQLTRHLSRIQMKDSMTNFKNDEEINLYAIAAQAQESSQQLVAEAASQTLLHAIPETPQIAPQPASEQPRQAAKETPADVGHQTNGKQTWV